MLANHHSREWMVYNKTDEHVLTIIISIDIRVANNFLVFGHASQAVEARESANRCDLGVVGEFPWFLESCIYIDSYIHHMHIQSHISHKDIIIRLLYPHLMTYINPISSHIIRYHQVSSDIIRYHQISSDITWYHLIPFDIIWYHLILIILLTESTSFFRCQRFRRSANGSRAPCNGATLRRRLRRLLQKRKPSRRCAAGFLRWLGWRWAGI
jgi:hypothetical protein